MTPQIGICLPPAVAAFMHNTLAYLSEFARIHELRVVPFENAEAASHYWCHNYYGEIAGHRIALQVWTDFAHAIHDSGFVNEWVLLGKDADWEWALFNQSCVQGMPNLMRQAAHGLLHLQRRCGLGMPGTAKDAPVA